MGCHEKLPVIQGSGGGGKDTPYEAPNTLRSAVVGRILDLVAHGPIYGLVDGLKSVYLDDTPVQNADGSFNFRGITIETREGYPEQTHIAGFRSIENPIEVNTEIRYDSPVVRAITNTDADAVLVTVQVNALSKTNDDGDIYGHSVPLAIDVRTQGGAWVLASTHTIRGKTVSAYQETYRVPLPGQGPHEIRVRRLNRESNSVKIQDSVQVRLITEVIDAKLNYPDSAVVGITIDSRLFGASLPSRAYDMKLSIIKVPSNYDPETREYTGLWDGTFKMAWSDNPAWAFYDLATHPVIGAGLTNVNKWALYRIGQYCDELVDDGYGGKEPRFTINTLINDRDEAIAMLNNLAGVFRGMVYCSADTIEPVADMPADPVKLVTPANVVGGEFEYRGTSLRERHSVAVVMWNDPDDGYKQKPEYVEDPASIELFGWRETQITAFGCTSRGQARRLGLWVLYSEREETQTLTYKAQADQADLRPGDFIEVADPDRAGARMGGRVVATDVLTLELDAVPAQASDGATWFFSVVLPNGSIERREVLYVSGNKVTLKLPLSAEPIVGAVWMLSSEGLQPPMYRVVSNQDNGDGTYTITATEHDPLKYDRVEKGLVAPERPTSLIPTGELPPPESVDAEPFTYLAGGTEHQGLLFSWSAVQDVRVRSYILEVKSPREDEFRSAYSGGGTSYEERDVAPGQWMMRVASVSETGRMSRWVAKTLQVSDLLLPAAPDRIEVSASTFSVALTPRGKYPGTQYEFWRSEVPLPLNLIESNARLLAIATNLVDTGLKADTEYFYYVRGANAYGVSEFVPVQAKTDNDFGDIITALDEDIRRPGGLFEQMVDSAKEAVADGIVDEVAESLDEELGDLRDSLSRTRHALALEEIRHLAALALNEGISARATVEEGVRADEDAAIAARVETLQASFNGLSATLTTEYSTKAYADGAVARAVTTAEVDGRKAVFGISVDGQVAEIGAIADRFFVYNPIGGDYVPVFAIENGKTIIRSALINQADILNLIVTGELRSSNYIPGQQGIRLNFLTGEFEFNGGVSGQGKTIIDNRGVRVYDNQDPPQLRVQIGDLSYGD